MRNLIFPKKNVHVVCVRIATQYSRWPIKFYSPRKQAVSTSHLAPVPDRQPLSPRGKTRREGSRFSAGDFLARFEAGEHQSMYETKSKTFKSMPKTRDFSTFGHAWKPRTTWESSKTCFRDMPPRFLDSPWKDLSKYDTSMEFLGHDLEIFQVEGH